MNIYKPYTYLIGWSEKDLWYYGVRYAKNCNPDDLWIKYFTSSKYVKEIRKLYGDPDIIEVRKIFDNKETALEWEYKVLRRMKVVVNEKWINRTAAPAQTVRDISGNKNPMKDPETAKKVANKLSILNKQKMSNMTKEEKSLKYGQQKEKNHFYNKKHTKNTKEKISIAVKKSTCHNKVQCHICGVHISKINLSRHLYLCSDGCIGTKANATRKGLKYKKK